MKKKNARKRLTGTKRKARKSAIRRRRSGKRKGGAVQSLNRKTNKRRKPVKGTRRRKSGIRTKLRGKRRRVHGKRSKRRLVRRRRRTRTRTRKAPVYLGPDAEVIYGQYHAGTGRRSAGISTRPLVRGVSVIILTWNGLDYTRRCLELIKDAVIGNPIIEVIVFDNGSTDGTGAYLQSLPWIKPVLHGTNVGFAQGNNIAVSYSRPGNDLLLLNNDVYAEQHDWITMLQETAHSEANIGVVGCRLLYENRLLQHAGTIIYPDDCYGQMIGATEIDINQYNRMRDVQGIVFACAYIRREVVQRTGLLDADYVSYFEDTDYCLRAMESGFRVVYDPRVTMVHNSNTTSQVNNVDFWGRFGKAQAVFRSKWRERLMLRYDQTLNWRSVANLPAFGYAESSRKLMNELDGQRVLVSYSYAYGPGTPQPAVEPETGDDYGVNLFRLRPSEPHRTEVVYGQADVFFRNQGKYKIGYTMLEIDGLPREWTEQCNRMNEVWVPSHFNLTTFRASGVRVPIYVMPLGVDPNYFNPDIWGYRFSEKFTFLSVFEWSERKAPDVLLRTFAKVFRHNKNVLLVCKITNLDANVDVPAEIRKLHLGPGAANIMIILNQHMPHYLMGSLYRSADCYVSTSRGEGWGMPMMEAMACGLPVIAPNWSGQTEFLNNTTGYPLQVDSLVPAVARTSYYNGFRWAQINEEHLAHLMRHVYENREAARRKALAASGGLAAHWTWAHAAARIKERLRQIR